MNIFSIPNFYLLKKKFAGIDPTYFSERNAMKTIYLILVLFLTLTISISSAEANSLCYLYVAEPTIIHNVYGPNTSSNPVNAGVLNILKAKGFNITNNSHYAN